MFRQFFQGKPGIEEMQRRGADFYELKENLRANLPKVGDIWWIYRPNRLDEVKEVISKDESHVDRSYWMKGIIKDVAADVISVEVSYDDDILTTWCVKFDRATQVVTKVKYGNIDRLEIDFKAWVSHNFGDAKDGLNVDYNNKKVVVQVTREINLTPSGLLEWEGRNLRLFNSEYFDDSIFLRSPRELKSSDDRNKVFSQSQRFVATDSTKIDYFISHGWGDDASLKCESFRALIDRFRKKRGRFPTIWLDTACVDLSNISDYLLAMPIHIASCHKLCALIGRTYLLRMWCLYELFFVFWLHDNGIELEVEVIAIEELCEEFCLNDAHCFSPNEERLLRNVIYSYGGDRFEDFVRYILVNRRLPPLEMLSTSAVDVFLKSVDRQFQFQSLRSHICECVRGSVSADLLSELLNILRTTLEVSDDSQEVSVSALLAVCKALKVSSLGSKANWIDILLDIRQFVMQRAVDMAREQGSRPWRRSRLMILGQGRAGKSSFLRALSGQCFNPTMPSTKGLAMNDFFVEIGDAGVNIKDYMRWTERSADVTEGMQTLRQAACTQAKNINAKTIQRKNPPKKLPGKSILSKITRVLSSKPKPVPNEAILTGCKVNVPTPAQEYTSPTDTASNATKGTTIASTDNATRMGDVSLTISSRDADSITFSVWDYGGQRVFQTMQHILLTRDGVFALVFDMHKLSPRMTTSETLENSIDYLRHWLKQIHMLANGAPIILVGTHKDDPKLAQPVVHQEISRNLSELFKQQQSNIVMNNNDGLCFFPVDNTDCDDPSIVNLRRLLEEVVERDSVGYVNEGVPISWLNMCDNLRQLERSGMSYVCCENPSDVVDKPDIRSIALTCGVITKNDNPADQDTVIASLLTSLSDKGILLYFPFEANLRNIIVLNPQWIIDLIVYVVRDFSLHPCSRDYTVIAHHRDKWYSFTRHGLLYDSVLDILLGGEIGNKSFLLTIMEKLRLGCRVNSSLQEAVYLVPSIVMSSDETLPNIPIVVDWRNTWSQGCSGVITVCFRGITSVPEGLFARLIVQLLLLCPNDVSMPLPQYVGLNYIGAPCVFFSNGAHCAAINYQDVVIILRPSGTVYNSIEAYVSSSLAPIGPDVAALLTNAIQELNQLFYNDTLDYVVQQPDSYNLLSADVPPGMPKTYEMVLAEISALDELSSSCGGGSSSALPLTVADDIDGTLIELEDWLHTTAKINKNDAADNAKLLHRRNFDLNRLYDFYADGIVTLDLLKEMDIGVINANIILKTLAKTNAPVIPVSSLVVGYFTGRQTEANTIGNELAPVIKIDVKKMMNTSIAQLDVQLESGYTMVHLSCVDHQDFVSHGSRKNTLPFVRADDDKTFPEPELLCKVIGRGTEQKKIECVFINASSSMDTFGTLIPNYNKYVTVIGWKTRLNPIAAEYFAKEFYNYLRSHPNKYEDAFEHAIDLLYIRHQYLCVDPDNQQLLAEKMTREPNVKAAGVPYLVNKSKFDIFFSHPWRNKNVLRHVYDHLVSVGYRVWYDENEMGWDLKKSMQEGITNSKVVLVCLNQAYEASKNCMHELIESSKIDKTIFTLATEAEPLTWAGKNTKYGDVKALCQLESYMFIDIGKICEHPSWNSPPVDTTLLCELKNEVDKLVKYFKGVNCRPVFGNI